MEYKSDFAAGHKKIKNNTENRPTAMDNVVRARRVISTNINFETERTKNNVALITQGFHITKSASDKFTGVPLYVIQSIGINVKY